MRSGEQGNRLAGRRHAQVELITGDFLNDTPVKREKLRTVLRVWTVVGLAVSEHIAVETIGEFALGHLGNDADGDEDKE